MYLTLAALDWKSGSIQDYRMHDLVGDVEMPRFAALSQKALG